MTNRIIGINVARALAVIGMIIVNFKIVIGSEGNEWLVSLAHIFDGKAAATFVVLAGVGLALMTNSALRDNNIQKLQLSHRKIIRRAAFLFVTGLSYIWIWPADILHFYAIYMLVTLIFMRSKSSTIIIGILVIIMLFPVMLLIWNYETAWNFTTLEYSNFWTFNGFIRNLFYNGFHPVIPWAAFMLFGLWFGRQDLNNNKFVKASFWTSLIVFVLINKVVSIGLINFLAEKGIDTVENLIPFFGTNPMPPMPLYMINGMATAVLVISGCILIAKKYPENKIIRALNSTGQLALTFYVAHVVIGMGLIEILLPHQLGTYSIEFSLLYALVFSLLCFAFSIVWLRYKKAGPLEWVMRKICG
jgi:uncharacterized protein